MIAHDLVKRAEGFVHQEQVGVEGERAGDGGALLHAAGKLPGIFLAETGEIDEVERALDARLLVRRRVAHDFERQGDVLFDGAPGIERGGLEDIAVGAALAGLLGRQAVDGDRAGCRLFEIGDDPQERRLAAAGRADEGDEIALLDGEVHAGQRRDGAIGGLEGEAEIFRGDDGIG